MKAVVCVCTCERPKMLERCLDSLSRQELPEGASLSVVVVDNERLPNNEGSVAARGFHYAHEPRRGIPAARNKAIEQALALGAEWVAFIDDDQIAHPAWVANHLKAAARYGADVVYPDVIPIYPEPAPFWSTGVNRDPSQKLAVHPGEGRIKKSAGTSGVMFSARLIRANGLDLRFDERLALAGGEDVEFFHNAHRQGAKIVWSGLPIVMEEISRSRLTYRRYVMRGLARGGQLFATYRQKNGYWLALQRYFAVSLARIFRGIGQLLISPLFLPFDRRRFKFTALEGGRNIFLAAGAIGGLFSLQYEYYRRIDGH